MNYNNIYQKIVENRKNNKYDGYTETHHILPVCLGGTNDKDNLVDLSAREHFICHLLLTKIYYGDKTSFYKLVRAFMMMCNCRSSNQQRYYNSKIYKNLKESFSLSFSISQTGSGNSQFGTRWIHNNELKISKKIKLSEEIQEGWHLGRVTNFDEKLKKERIKNENREISRSEKILTLEKDRNSILGVLENYIDSDYNSLNSFIPNSTYEFSLVSFTRKLKKYIPEYTSISKQGSHNVKESLREWLLSNGGCNLKVK